MRLMSVLFLTLAACPGTSGKDSDSGAVTDDSTGTDCTGAPLITDWNYDCDGGSPETCTWWVEADHAMGVVTVTVVETGDPTSTCGPKGGVNECGVWEETHNGFTAAGTGSSGGACGERKELALSVKDDFTQQVDNQSTLFNAAEMDKITILLTVEDSSGAAADCDVFGHDVSFFAAECSN